MKNHKAHNSGFTLVQISILLLVASLVLVTILPSTKSTLDNNKVTYNRLNQLMTYYRAYMAANGALPCPADASLAMGAANYGVAAANSGSTNDCSGSTPAANYVDASNNVAIGMVPYKTLGIPRELIYDSWGRAITYAVDTAVTGSCWSTPATGAITVTDNGSAQNTVIALVSHGANGHGAWIPLTGSSGTAVRLNNNSSNSNELMNAHVDSSFAATSTLTNFVITTPSSTFDDVIVYKSHLWTMNARPSAASGASGSTITAVSTPTSGYYFYRELPRNYQNSTISFTVTFDSAVTVSTAGGTPRIALTASSVNSGTVSLTGNSGSGAIGYANYASGSPGTTLTFTYPVQSTDMAPNGLTMATSIDMNGGSITSLCSSSFTTPTLTGIVIPKVQAITASGTWTVPVDWNNSLNTIHAIGSGGNGAQGSATTGGAGGGGGAHAAIGNYSYTPGSSISVTVGTGGGTTKTIFEYTTTLNADYGRNASGTTAGVGGSASSSYPATGASSGGNGGNNGGTTRGGGGGGGGAAGPASSDYLGSNGRNGGAGANTGGGGGGGGGANNGSGSATVGANGASSGSNGGHGGRGYNGTAVSNRGSAGGGNASAGTTDKGTGGGGGGGSNSASINSGSGGVGSMSITNGSDYIGWTTNVGSVATYGAGGGGGGSGGANGATSNSGNGGNGGGYGGGGGGSGGATGTRGSAGSGANGLIMVIWR